MTNFIGGDQENEILKNKYSGPNFFNFRANYIIFSGKFLELRTIITYNNSYHF